MRNGTPVTGIKAQLARTFVATMGRVENPALLPAALARAGSFVPAGDNGLALLHEFAGRPEWPARYLAARLLGERSAAAGPAAQEAAWHALRALADDPNRWVTEGVTWGLGALLRADPGRWGPRFAAAFDDRPPDDAPGSSAAAPPQGSGGPAPPAGAPAPPAEDRREAGQKAGASGQRSAAPAGAAGDRAAVAPAASLTTIGRLSAAPVGVTVGQALAEQGGEEGAPLGEREPPGLRRVLLFGVVPALRDGPAAARRAALEIVDRAAADRSSATRQVGSLVVGREAAAHTPAAALELVERWAASGDPARQWQAARALTPALRAVDAARSAAVIAQLERVADPAVRNALRGALKGEAAGVSDQGSGGSDQGAGVSGQQSASGGLAEPWTTRASPDGHGRAPAVEPPAGPWPLAPDNWQTTADIPISERLIDQVVGQDRSVEIIRLAARQKRFVLMVGEPGTGKSMLGAAMAEMMGADDLEDVLVQPNAESRITPLIEAVPAGEGERLVREAKQRRGEAETAISYVFWAAIVAVSLIAAWYGFTTRSAVPGLIGLVAASVLWGARRFFRSPARLSVPKLLMNNARAVEANLAPFVDATGFHAGALLGDVRHDPFQSGGYETPPHELVEPGAIHLAHRGVLFIDEVSTLSIESQQSLLTAIQEKRFPISGRTLGSSGTMIRTAPAPCDFLLILAGNMQDVEKMHPALRSRVRGYGYELYMNEDMPDTAENRARLARFCAQEVAKDRKIPHLSRAAVEAVIDQARVRAGRRDRLTVRLRELGGLVRAAGDLAAQAGDALVEPRHVRAARENTRTLEEQMQAGTYREVTTTR